MTRSEPSAPRRRSRANTELENLADVHFYIFVLEQTIGGIKGHKTSLARARAGYLRAHKKLSAKGRLATYRAVSASYVCLLEQKLEGADVPDHELRTVKQTYTVVLDDI